MAEFGNGLTEESLLDSDPGHPDLEDPGVGDEEPGLEEGEAAIEDPVSEGHCFDCGSPVLYPRCPMFNRLRWPSVETGRQNWPETFSSKNLGSHAMYAHATAKSILAAIVVHAML